jgi:hypothetical protein
MKAETPRNMPSGSDFAAAAGFRFGAIRNPSRFVPLAVRAHGVVGVLSFSCSAARLPPTSFLFGFPSVVPGQWRAQDFKDGYSKLIEVKKWYIYMGVIGSNTDGYQ